jgi:hypothetical protein
MAFFGRKKEQEKRGRGWGRAIVESVYTGDELDRLLSAVDTVAEAFGNPISKRLADELVHGTFTGPRTAVNSLRKEGLAAIPAIPAIGAWVRSSIGRIPDDAAGYGVREGLLALGDLRRMVMEQAMGGPPPLREALRVLAGFLEGDVEASARELLTTANGRAARGAISYLRDSRGEMQASLDAIEGYLDEHPGETGDGDFDYGRNDAMYAMQDLAARIRRSVPTEPSAGAAAPTATAPLIADVTLPDKDFDDTYDDDDDDDDDDAEERELRQLNIAAEVAKNRAIAALLLDRVRTDPDAQVRAAALDALRLGISDAETLLDTARACMTDDAPYVRIAAVRLLSRLL